MVNHNIIRRSTGGGDSREAWDQNDLYAEENPRNVTEPTDSGRVGLLSKIGLSAVPIGLGALVGSYAGGVVGASIGAGIGVIFDSAAYYMIRSNN